MLLATDGLINAFADDEQWHAFGVSLQDRVREFGWPSVASALPGWLDHYSEAASGDDITLAVAVLGLAPPRIARAGNAAGGRVGSDAGLGVAGA